MWIKYNLLDYMIYSLIPIVMICLLISVVPRPDIRSYSCNSALYVGDIDIGEAVYGRNLYSTQSNLQAVPNTMHIYISLIRTLLCV
jgi:hypothetical protein